VRVFVPAGAQVGRFSVEYWRRAVAAYGVDGVARAIGRSFRSRVAPIQTEPMALDLSEVTDDPMEALHLGFESGSVPVLEVPVSALRAERLGVRLDDPGANPFTRAVAGYLSGACPVYEGSAMQRFYQSWQPGTLEDFLGVGTGLGSNLRQTLLVDVLPWERPVGQDELAARRQAEERTWLLKFGPAPGAGHGSSYFGPTSDALGAYRFGKHTKVAASIAQDATAKGTASKDWWDPSRGGYIEVQLLVGDDRWAGIIREGKHRSTALAALEIPSLIVSVPRSYPVIRREEAGSWPGVRQGFYTLDEALRVFDRFLAGEPPASFPAVSLPHRQAPVEAC
jgi:hypothetical protein